MSVRRPLCFARVPFYTQAMVSEAAERRPLKVFQTEVWSQAARKIHSDISPTPPLNFTVIVKNCYIWPHCFEVIVDYWFNFRCQREGCL